MSWSEALEDGRHCRICGHSLEDLTVQERERFSAWLAAHPGLENPGLPACRECVTPQLLEALGGDVRTVEIVGRDRCGISMSMVKGYRMLDLPPRPELDK
jgi:hypothetical protein